MQKWDVRFLGLAREVASWAKDPSTKVGAVAVSETQVILSCGWNGFPREIADKSERLNDRELKYRYVVHAEANCIYNATRNGVSLLGATMYIHGMSVCHECAKALIQVGIKRVVMCYSHPAPTKWAESHAHTRDMFDEAGVTCISYDTNALERVHE